MEHEIDVGALTQQLAKVLTKLNEVEKEIQLVSPLWLRIKDAAHYVSVSERTFKSWINIGYIDQV